MSHIIRHINIHPYLVQGTTHVGKNDGYLANLGEFSEAVDHIAEYARSFGSEPFICAMDVNEGRVYTKEIEPRFRELRSILESKVQHRYKFICDGDHLEYYRMDSSDIIYVHYLNLVTYVHGCLSSNQKRNTQWNSQTRSGLFTPGNMNRFNRAMVLRRLWENNSLNRLMWSCHYSKKHVDFIKNEFFSDYSDDKFQKFMTDTSSTLDLKPVNGNDDFVYVGYPYDHTMYEKTLFSLLAESDFAIAIDSEIKFLPKITEKSYRAIINMHPFILSWHRGFLSMLESKGYRTFKEYMLIPEYNDIVDQQERLSATIKNIESFAETSRNHIDAINNDVEHNYNLFVRNANDEVNKLHPILGIDQTDIPDFRLDLVKFVHMVWPTITKFWAPTHTS